MDTLMLIFVAISLSMDAFSLSLAYGTLNLGTKNIRNLTLIVSFYHFCMPILAFLLSKTLTFFVHIPSSILVFVVLFIIGIEMILDKQEEHVHMMKWRDLLLFGFAVSMDSFSVGIGLPSMTSHLLLGPILFSIASGLFTFLGLYLGKKNYSENKTKN